MRLLLEILLPLMFGLIPLLAGYISDGRAGWNDQINRGELLLIAAVLTGAALAALVIGHPAREWFEVMRVILLLCTLGMLLAIMLFYASWQHDADKPSSTAQATPATTVQTTPRSVPARAPTARAQATPTATVQVTPSATARATASGLLLAGAVLIEACALIFQYSTRSDTEGGR